MRYINEGLANKRKIKLNQISKMEHVIHFK